jgi:hypothetical protein
MEIGNYEAKNPSGERRIMLIIFVTIRPPLANTTTVDTAGKMTRQSSFEVDKEHDGLGHEIECSSIVTSQ